MIAPPSLRDLDPQMRAVFDQLVEAGRGQPDRWSVPISQARAQMLAGRRHWQKNPPAVHDIQNLAIPGPFRPVPLRIFRPNAAANLAGLIYLHGGGWAMGDLDTHDVIMRRLALATGMVVIGVDYAKAPEWKFPKPVDEVIAAIPAIAGRAADWGIDAKRLAVGGDSAGANLAVAAAVALKTAAPGLIRAGVLFYGAFVGVFDTPSYRRLGHGVFGLSTGEMEKFLALYVEHDNQRIDPRIDVVCADLRGLPPLGIYPAGADPLVDDSTILAEALKASGAAYELVVYDGLIHSFLHYADHVDRARQAFDRAATFLRQV